MIMNNEIPRRSFFSAAALSPLAWLGLRKKEPKDEPHPYPFYGMTHPYPFYDTWKKCAEAWEKTARLRDADADYWKGRALLYAKMMRLNAKEYAKEIHALRKETA